MSQIEQLVVAELRMLRKGRGILAADFDRRLGPNLRQLIDGGQSSGGGHRQALVTELTAHAAALTEESRIAVLAGLGLTPETTGMTTFADRIAWLAARIGYAYRTALRRADAAEQELAEHIAIHLRRTQPHPAGYADGWHLRELRTLLRLDTLTPEAHEHRTITATRDGVTEVVAWHDVPAGAGGRPPLPSAEMLYGGHLVGYEQPGASLIRFVVRLPAPLRAGESHEYGMILRVPAGQPMRPHYIFTPECPCDRFDLRVRFPLDPRPQWVRRVRAETVRTFDAGHPGDDLLELDDAGEVHVWFHVLTMHLGYGVQWQP